MTLFDAGPQDLDRHLATVRERREVDLRDRGARDRHLVELREHLRTGLP